MDTIKKSPIPRGQSATKAKNKYRDKTYDRMELAVPKGFKAAVEEIAKKNGKSKNSYVIEAIQEKYRNDTGHEIISEK